MTAPPCWIRPARRHDIVRLSQIWAELMALHSGRDDAFELAVDARSRWEQMVGEMVDRGDTFVHLAEGPRTGRGTTAEADAPAPLGFCLGWVARNPPIYRLPEVGFVSEVAVASSARRQGVGRALIGSARAWFKARGLTEFQLATAVWNDDAHAFWRALGGAPLLLRFRFRVEAPTLSRA